MKNGDKNRIIIFGGNRLQERGPLLEFALLALKKGYQVIIFTEKLHLDMDAGDGNSLRQHLTKENLEFVEIDKPSVELVHRYIDDNTIGLLTNAVWLIKQDVIDLFKGKLYNYHNACLPLERGAAAYSWKILSQNPYGGLTIHKVVEKLDSGDIVLYREIIFPKECRIPQDYYFYLKDIEVAFFSEFLDKIESDEGLVTISQLDSNSRYWPRLNTDQNGYINWDWQCHDIELFINAFDSPHKGASTFLCGERIHLKQGARSVGEGVFHPFQAGIVFRKVEAGIFIAATGGCLIIKEVLDENGENIINKVKVGQRFFTPYSYLEKAKTVEIIHNSKEIKVRHIVPNG